MARFLDWLRSVLGVLLNVKPDPGRVPPPGPSSFKHARYEGAASPGAGDPASMDDFDLGLEDDDDEDDAPAGRPSDGARFVAKPALFNASERTLFADLRSIVGDRAFVLAMVRMEDVLTPARDQPREVQYAARGRIKARHFDFVIVDDRGAPLLVLELDGPHHRRSRVRAADEFKDEACAMAGIRLIRVPPGYRLARLERMVREAMML